MTYQVVNPATGKVEREYPTATDAEIQEVLERSARGYASWRRTSLAERAKILSRVAQLYRDRADELAAIITREMGKPTRAAKGELRFVSGIYKYYADNGADAAQGRAAAREAAGHGLGAQRPRSARCWASCRGTTPTTRSPGSPPRT